MTLKRNWHSSFFGVARNTVTKLQIDLNSVFLLLSSKPCVEGMD
jgi:hypothetical protein